jgi:thiol:disulfide interchange protein DsbG
MKNILILSALFLGLWGAAFPAKAQQDNTAIPELPAPIQNLVDEGAQIRYLGREHGLDSWITIKNGQEQYFYVLPDRSAFVMGVLFDQEGKLVTVDQVQRLRARGDTLLDTLASENTFSQIEADRNTPNGSDELKSPAERLFADIENSNWVPLGQQGAPVLYSFIDPQCPHCHEFINDLRKGYLDQGKVQLRMIPVGFKDETRAQAAYLMATPEPQKHWYAHMDGDKNALPAKSEINQQGVQKNLAIMQSWQFNVTPMIVYRGKDGTVKLLQGRPKDLPAMIADIGARS